MTERGPHIPLPALGRTEHSTDKPKAGGPQETMCDPVREGSSVSVPGGWSRRQQLLSCDQALGPERVHRIQQCQRGRQSCLCSNNKAAAGLCALKCCSARENFTKGDQAIEERETSLLSFSVRKITSTWYHFTVCTKNLGEAHLLGITSLSGKHLAGAWLSFIFLLLLLKALLCSLKQRYFTVPRGLLLFKTAVIIAKVLLKYTLFVFVDSVLIGTMLVLEISVSLPACSNSRS